MYLGYTDRDQGQEAELQDGCCQGQQGQEQLKTVTPLMHILHTLSSHGVQLSAQHEQSTDKKHNLQDQAPE